MSTPAHIISGAYLGVLAGHILPSETNYILIALTSGGILDLDHIYYFIKDWKYYQKNGFIGTMHHARSVFHELFGFTIFGILMFGISFVDLKLAYVVGVPAMIHIIEDILMGRSTPLAPFDKTEISVVPQKKSVKIFIDISVLIIFTLLWTQYLTGPK